MIITRTPFRISFAGGGSDFQEYYKEEPGAVVSVTIDKYVYLSMHPLFHRDGYFLKYSSNEMCGDVDLIRHPIIREVFTRQGIHGVDFNSSSDVPAGTGLGSSSSFTVGLLNLCYSYRGLFRNEKELAKEACDIEIDTLQSPIGKQDQYASAFGGLNFISFHPDESVKVEKIHMNINEESEFEQSLMLFYLGYSRPAATILTEQKANSKRNRLTLHKMVELAHILRQELKASNIDNIGEILHANWEYKKELANNITNDKINSTYQLARNAGATGGKLLGAGGTGFILLYVPKNKRANIQKAMNLLNMSEFSFRFENSGTSVIY